MKSLRLLAAVPLIACAGVAHAYLGGFENADGYQPFLNMVQHYNAGQYGPNSGYIAMAPTPITPGTGLWSAISGGFGSGGGVSYATGHQFYDRTWVNSNNTMGSGSDQALVVTTGHEGIGGPPVKYKYNLDSSDLGVAPAATGGMIVNVSFWVRGFLDPGLVGVGYFGNEITFEDSTGNIGFNLGMTKTAGGDRLTYWNGSSLFVSSILPNSSRYDRWDIKLDLANDTITASYFEFNTSTLTNLITNAPMSAAMSDFSHLTFRTSPGVNNAKLYSVDDFSIRAIPAPGTLAVALAGLALAKRRRR